MVPCCAVQCHNAKWCSCIVPHTVRTVSVRNEQPSASVFVSPATDIKDLPGAISPSEMRDKFGLKDGAENPLMKRRWYIQVGGRKRGAVTVLVEVTDYDPSRWRIGYSVLKIFYVYMYYIYYIRVSRCSMYCPTRGNRCPFMPLYQAVLDR